MLRYETPLIPGPTRVPPAVLEAFATDYPASDLEEEFTALYAETEARLRRIVAASGRVAVMTGEGMVALWGALKSVVGPGDHVLAVAAGVFGEGIGAMAEGLGADVVYERYRASAVPDAGRVGEAARRHDPAVVTLVHCETPSGTLAPLAELCAAVREAAPDALIYVDAVSSAAGAPVRVDDWGIDLCLMGAQKALSAPPDAAMIAVSERAWTRIESVAYAGYDALAPWRNIGPPGSFPYTPSWHATAAIHTAAGLVLAEGLDAVFHRHTAVAAHCRDRARALGLELFPENEAAASPTVTGLRVPRGWTWDRLDGALREHGVALGGNWGELAGKVFRIGHMGDQARADLVDSAFDVLEKLLRAET